MLYNVFVSWLRELQHCVEEHRLVAVVAAHRYRVGMRPSRIRSPPPIGPGAVERHFRTRGRDWPTRDAILARGVHELHRQRRAQQHTLAKHTHIPVASRWHGATNTGSYILDNNWERLKADQTMEHLREKEMHLFSLLNDGAPVPRLIEWAQLGLGLGSGLYM